jgi:hypothetical protein
MIVQLRSFLLSLMILQLMSRHHSAKEEAEEEGARCPKPQGQKILNQNCWVKTQEVKMCCTISWAWSHKGKTTGCGSPLFCNLSAVQTLYQIGSHKKNLHFGVPKTSTTSGMNESTHEQEKARERNDASIDSQSQDPDHLYYWPVAVDRWWGGHLRRIFQAKYPYRDRINHCVWDQGIAPTRTGCSSICRSSTDGRHSRTALQAPNLNTDRSIPSSDSGCGSWTKQYPIRSFSTV